MLHGVTVTCQASDINLDFPWSGSKWPKRLSVRWWSLCTSMGWYVQNSREQGSFARWPLKPGPCQELRSACCGQLILAEGCNDVPPVESPSDAATMHARAGDGIAAGPVCQLLAHCHPSSLDATYLEGQWLRSPCRAVVSRNHAHV